MQTFKRQNHCHLVGFQINMCNDKFMKFLVDMKWLPAAYRRAIYLPFAKLWSCSLNGFVWKFMFFVNLQCLGELNWESGHMRKSLDETLNDIERRIAELITLFKYMAYKEHGQRTFD